MLGADLAMDLGAVNTRISVSGEGLILNEPSVVAVQRESGKILSGGCAVGHLARQMLGRTPDSIRVVRPMRDGVIADFQLCEAMLKYFLRKSARSSWGVGPRILTAAPGCVTAVEKRALYNSSLRAGAREVLVMPKAKAAAVGCGLPVHEPVASMVCDIGGGTTEVAVLSLGDCVASQSVRAGGDAMDQAIVDYLKRHYNLRVGLTVAERLRIDIGSAFPLDRELTDEANGVDVIGGLPRKATITSEEIREALAVPLQRIVEAIKATLDGCGPDLAADLVDHGLVLVGGGALLRGMDQFIMQQTGLPARVSQDATCAVAKGAQICLENLSQWRSWLESSDDDV
jgi:rod shape-determining protein MreB